MDLSHIHLAVCREKFSLHLAIDNICWADRIRQDKTGSDRIREEATWFQSHLPPIPQNTRAKKLAAIGGHICKFSEIQIHVILNKSLIIMPLTFEYNEDIKNFS